MYQYFTKTNDNKAFKRFFLKSQSNKTKKSVTDHFIPKF